MKPVTQGSADAAWALVFSASAVLTVELEVGFRWLVLGTCCLAYLWHLKKQS
jgi:hypothetical protein